jgi:hypothetical protein
VIGQDEHRNSYSSRINSTQHSSGTLQKRSAP